MRLKNSIAFGLFLALVCPACKQNKNVQQGAGNDYPLLTLTREDRKLSVKYSAVIEGKQDVEIRPQVSGFITDVRVKEGAYVNKGDILFVIDQVPYQAALQKAEANVASAEANLAIARQTLEGKQLLHDEKSFRTLNCVPPKTITERPAPHYYKLRPKNETPKTTSPIPKCEVR